MAPFYVDIGSTAPTAWTTTTTATNAITTPSMLWNLYNQTPCTTPVTWIPVNATMSTIPISTPSYLTMVARHYGDYIEPIRNAFVPYTPAIIRRLTDRHEREELAAAAAAQRQALLERQEAERLARAGARERAKELLLAHLTPEQRHTFEKNEWFVVEGGRTKKKYKIYARNNSLNANIEVMGENHRLCAHCDHHVMPFNDHVLMQKVMLELDEDNFLRVANRHPMR